MHSYLATILFVAQTIAPTDGAIIFEPIGSGARDDQAITLPWSQFVQVVQRHCTESRVSKLGRGSFQNRIVMISIGFEDGVRYKSEGEKLPRLEIDELFETCGVDTEQYFRD